MEEEGTIERVKEILRRYSSRSTSSSDGSFLSDIDMSDTSENGSEEKPMTRVIKSLKSSLGMVEVLRERKTKIGKEDHLECLEVLDEIKRNIGSLEKPLDRKILAWMAVGVVATIIGMGYSLYF